MSRIRKTDLAMLLARGAKLRPFVPPKIRAKWGSVKKLNSVKPVRSSLEQQFFNHWQGPAFVEQYRFAPPRRWRFDFAWPDHKVAVEVDGGVFVHGGHSRGRQIMGDHEKRNAATMMGWRVFTLATDQITHEKLQEIRAFIETS